MLCVFKTDYWPRQVAIEKLYDHCREKHPCDRKDGPEKDMREVSEKVFWPDGVPDPISDDHKVVTCSGNEFCTEVIGTENWVKRTVGRTMNKLLVGSHQRIQMETPTTEW